MAEKKVRTLPKLVQLDGCTANFFANRIGHPGEFALVCCFALDETLFYLCSAISQRRPVANRVYT